MPVDEQEPAKTMLHQGSHHVARNRDQGALAQGNRTGKPHVMMGNAEIELGRDEHTWMVFGFKPFRYGVGKRGVTTQRKVGAVLFSRAHGDQHHFDVAEP